MYSEKQQQQKKKTYVLSLLHYCAPIHLNVTYLQENYVANLAVPYTVCVRFL